MGDWNQKEHRKTQCSFFSLAQNIKILPIKSDCIDKLSELPNIHNDPFDRMIIAQAQSENLTIITKDTKIKLYDVNVLG